jgi:hypothetical protein
LPAGCQARRLRPGVARGAAKVRGIDDIDAMDGHAGAPCRPTPPRQRVLTQWLALTRRAKPLLRWLRLWRSWWP